MADDILRKKGFEGPEELRAVLFLDMRDEEESKSFYSVIKDQNQSNSHTEIVPVSAALLGDMVTDRAILARGLLLTDWVPLEFTQDNLASLENVQKEQFYVIKKEVQNSKLLSFSHGRVTPKTLGKEYSCTIYTTTITEFWPHLKTHMKAAIAEQCLYFNCFYDITLEDQVRAVIPEISKANPFNCPTNTRVRIVIMQQNL